MRPITTDAADFLSLRMDGCTSVDKMVHMQSLISTKGSESFYLSRPAFGSKMPEFVDFDTEKLGVDELCA